jgi:hypothetical protein
MRAVFPPQVTSVLQHPAAAPVPQQYRLELTEAEKRAAIATPDDLPLPAPPHDPRDFFVTRGGEPISKLQHLSLIFSIPNFTGTSGLANQPNWFKNSGPYFGDSFTGSGAGGAERDRDFWTLEILHRMTASSFAPGASSDDAKAKISSAISNLADDYGRRALIAGGACEAVAEALRSAASDHAKAEISSARSLDQPSAVRIMQKYMYV